ncbi:hypothetical protein CHUAL_007319 [Chamberlinius hualienensis]
MITLNARRFSHKFLIIIDEDRPRSLKVAIKTDCLSNLGPNLFENKINEPGAKRHVGSKSQPIMTALHSAAVATAFPVVLLYPNGVSRVLLLLHRMRILTAKCLNELQVEKRQ